MTVKVTVTTSVADNRPGKRKPSCISCWGCHGDELKRAASTPGVVCFQIYFHVVQYKEKSCIQIMLFISVVSVILHGDKVDYVSHTV